MSATADALTVAQAVRTWGTPGELVRAVEDGLALPHGDEERFAGYGVMGQPFHTGDVLGMRRFPASSVGPGYSSVWHRDPAGVWTFYQDQPPDVACTRYFGDAVTHVRTEPISVRADGDRDLTIRVGGADAVEWRTRWTAILATRAFNRLAARLPASALRSDRILGLLGRMAGPVLGAGRVQLTGTVPNGQRFLAIPRALWVVDDARATVGGRSLGPIGPVTRQARLADFHLPQRGLLAVGEGHFR